MTAADDTKAAPQAHCVALSGTTFANRALLKSWGFAWNPITKTWNRIVRDLGAGKTLARFCEANGYDVLYHPARPEEIDPRKPGPTEDQFERHEDRDPQQIAPGHARSYYNAENTGHHYAGNANRWNRKARGT